MVGPTKDVVAASRAIVMVTVMTMAAIEEAVVIVEVVVVELVGNMIETLMRD